MLWDASDAYGSSGLPSMCGLELTFRCREWPVRQSDQDSPESEWPRCANPNPECYHSRRPRCGSRARQHWCPMRCSATAGHHAQAVRVYRHWPVGFQVRLSCIRKGVLSDINWQGWCEDDFRREPQGRERDGCDRATADIHVLVAKRPGCADTAKVPAASTHGIMTLFLYWGTLCRCCCRLAFKCIIITIGSLFVFIRLSMEF